MSFASKSVKGLTPYVYGEQPNMFKGIIKLNTNENPFAPHPSFDRCLKNFSVDTLKYYCDPKWGKLTEVVSKVIGVNKKKLIFGNGSDEIIANIFKTFFDQKDSVLFTQYTYSYYKVFSQIHNIKTHILPMGDDFKIDLSKIKTLPVKVVFITNPNSPTGIALATADIEKAVKENKSKLFIIDEAYADFANENCLSLANNYSNVIVLRTTSKAYSFCGGRLGFAVGSIKNIEYLNKVRDPYNVNVLTQLLGREIFKHISYYNKNIEIIKKSRDAFSKKITELGFKVLPSSANFVMCSYVGVNMKRLAKHMAKNNIFIRYFDSIGLKKYIRISIGKASEMERVYNVLKKYI